MKINIDEIKELLASDVTGYHIGQNTAVKQQSYDLYKIGKSKLEKMPLQTAIELQKYIDNTKKPPSN